MSGLFTEKERTHMTWRGRDQLEEPRQKTGLARFWELLTTNFWNLFRANLFLLLGALPGVLLTVWGIWGRSLPIALAGGAAAGLMGGPLLCGLYGTILRALREEPGFWSLQYKHELKQDWKQALLPGAAMGLILALWLFEAAALGAQGPVSPVALFALAEVLFFVLGIGNYVFPQIVMVRVSTAKLYSNSIRLFIGLLPRSLAAAAVQSVYWVLFLLLLPRSVPVLMVTGFWLPCLLSMLILVRPMERYLGVSGEE